MLKFSGTLIWRLGNKAPIKKSAWNVSVFQIDKIHSSTNVAASTTSDKVLDDREHAGLVAAAFASLNTPDTDLKKPSPKSMKQNRGQQLDLQIMNATDVDGLLKVAENAIVSRRHALKMVSVLSDWSTNSKVKISDFEKDPRFLKLCRILARTPASHAMTSITMADDLSTVLGITGDDEAARLIANLSLPQLIKVMKALQQKGRRSTPLLRALSHHIVKQPDPIDLKKSADILYSMAALNFPDPVLLDRLCNDIITQLPSISQPAVVNSIVTSLGVMRYRHLECLSACVSWLLSHEARSADLATAAHTLATTGVSFPDCDTLLEIVVTLKEEDLSRPSCWLDLVFSLLILGRVSEAHVGSTLSGDFIDKLLASGEISIPSRRKLITIDAYAAHGLPSYSGPRLPEHISVGVPIVYTKEKCLFVQSVMDTFRNLISADSFMKRNCNSNMGFLYDAEFALDAKCHPVPLEKAKNNKSVFRIAVLCLDYHDLCRKVPEPLGIYQLYTRLLEMKGFKVMQIPYTEYNPKDKLVNRVQYIEKKMKKIVSDSVKQH